MLITRKALTSSRVHRSIALLPLLVLLVAVTALLFLWIRHSDSPAVADTIPVPASGLDISMGIDVDGDTQDDCSSSGTPTAKCDAAIDAGLTVTIYLNSLPSKLPTPTPSGTSGVYKGFSVVLSHAGITSSGIGSTNMDAWPDCGLPVEAFTPGLVAFGCATGFGGDDSTYVGKMGEVEFNCSADGTVTMIHGTDATAVTQDVVSVFAEGDGTTETLSINCGSVPSPTHTPSATATRTATSTPSPSPTASSPPNPSPSATSTVTATATDVPPGTRTATPSATPTTGSAPTSTPTPSATDTATATRTLTVTPTPTGTGTPTPTGTPTASVTPTPTSAATSTMTPTATATTEGLSGDVNADGLVNSIDALWVLMLHAEVVESLADPGAADVSGDGEINAVDAQLILQYEAGLLDGLPPPETMGPAAVRIVTSPRVCHSRTTLVLSLAKADR